MHTDTDRTQIAPCLAGLTSGPRRMHSVPFIPGAISWADSCTRRRSCFSLYDRAGGPDTRLFPGICRRPDPRSLMIRGLLTMRSRQRQGLHALIIRRLGGASP